jgi:hypothetical protein
MLRAGVERTGTERTSRGAVLAVCDDMAAFPLGPEGLAEDFAMTVPN